MVSQPVSLGSPNDFGPAVKVVPDHGVYIYKFTTARPAMVNRGLRMGTNLNFHETLGTLDQGPDTVCWLNLVLPSDGECLTFHLYFN